MSADLDLKKRAQTHAIMLKRLREYERACCTLDGGPASKGLDFDAWLSEELPADAEELGIVQPQCTHQAMARVPARTSALTDSIESGSRPQKRARLRLVWSRD